MFFVTAKVLNAFMELAQIMLYDWNSDGTPLITHAKRVILSIQIKCSKLLAF